MSLFPSETDARAFTDARAMIQWVGVPIEAFEAFESQMGKFANLIRNIALLPEKLIAPATAAARVPVANQADRLLTPLEVAQIGLCWRIARRLAADDWAAHVDVDPFAPAVVVAPAAQAAAAAAAPPPLLSRR